MRRKGLFAAVAAFAASPQGRRMMQQAKDYARSPEGKAKIAQLRNQVAQRRSTRVR
jgi:CHASE3 domain sensor protein